jgi:glycosyltransferase involved in cell wall biosynthesis
MGHAAAPGPPSGRRVVVPPLNGRPDRRPPDDGPGKRPVLMIVHSHYEEDPRVRREAESLVASGRPVLVLGLRLPGQPETGELAGVRIRRLDVQRHQGAGIGVYLREYVAFFVRSGWTAVRLHRRERFALVQVHSLPDLLAFAVLPLRIAGVPLILDLHEAMPEFFRTRFPGASNRLTHGLLLLQERLSIGISSITLSVNTAMRDRLVRLGVSPAKLAVVINSPSLARFDASAHPRRAFRADGSLRLIYTGGLTPTYEVDLAVRALATIARERPDLDARLGIYGRGDTEAALRALSAELGIAERVTFHGRIPIDDVPAAIASADIGLAPTGRDPFTDLTLSGKIYEYAAMGKPVVASDLPMVLATFPRGTVATYPSGDAAAMAGAILGFADDPIAREAAVTRMEALVRDAAWDVESVRYLEIVERLIGRVPPAGPA